eukprot:1566545-Prymnesium_polylepis.1
MRARERGLLAFEFQMRPKTFRGFGPFSSSRYTIVRVAPPSRANAARRASAPAMKRLGSIPS